ncbi:hypothetical protein BX616_002889 [Lobosporangium transversale]|nr:hypothetical protein BX616_002889 [Lobosporangium transversale]
MPPRNNASNVASYADNDQYDSLTNPKTTITLRAKKRKNLEKNDSDDDSDFDHTHRQHRLPQYSRPSKLKNEQSQQKQRTSPPLALNKNNESAKGQETWRAESSKSVCFTEEDRGFVFTRKKPITTTTVESTPLTATLRPPLSSRNKQDVDNSHDVDNPLLATPNPPMTPEGTPSRDRIYDVQAVRVKKTSKPTTTRQYQHQSRRQQQGYQQNPQTPQRNHESIVAIPMRETPMIKRNKDMRNDASRRSSFTLRGKRASSIGNGFSALPHPSIDPKNFFRHIAPDDPQPIRMKQLMTWCARKTIDLQKTHHQSALKVAKGVEEDVLEMLIAGQISVSWYNRPADAAPIQTVPKKPHQQNVDNLRKLQECEAQIAKLQQEDEEWTQLISSFNTFHASLLDNGPTLPPDNQPIVAGDRFANEIDIGMLTADERSLWEKYCKDKDSMSMPESASGGVQDTAVENIQKSTNENNKWMIEIMGSVEKEVDTLQDTLYTASQFDKVAKKYADQVLEQIAMALDERQRPTETLALLPALTSRPLMLDLFSGKKAASTLSEALGANSSSVTTSLLKTQSIGGDSPDDPRQILRALSRLSL